MDSTGMGKLRYVGGYVIHTLLTRAKKYASENMYSTSTEVGKNVEKAMLKIKLLKENVIVPYDKLSQTTQFGDTLQYTEIRQYRKRGLLHVTDEFFEFMLKLEQARVDNLKITKYLEFGDKFLFQVKENIMNDESKLVDYFENLFDLTSGICSTQNGKVRVKPLILYISYSQINMEFRPKSFSFKP